MYFFLKSKLLILSLAGLSVGKSVGISIGVSTVISVVTSVTLFVCAISLFRKYLKL